MSKLTTKTHVNQSHDISMGNLLSKEIVRCVDGKVKH